ncbi:acetyltransferase [Amylibacter sp. SFDW26]|uniref:GNAT family N-acetyltransferase n=1 Tax=Amylibacter sp. SFDW26 TaxID=2652722 RepID=UPI0012620404|nr:GNAT family N-acetyltransferase [Amylibacter sp. SFDW26]KAB7615849.1 acetyltransferase [Amylibacter sp. SFDW26]
MNIHVSNQSNELENTAKPSLVRWQNQYSEIIIERASENTVNITVGQTHTANARLVLNTTPELHLKSDKDQLNLAVIAGAIEWVFAQNADIINMKLVTTTANIPPRDVDFLFYDNGSYWVDRSGFYQSSSLWISHQPSGFIETKLVSGPDGRDHPHRPPAPVGLCYQRHDPVASLTVSFRALDIDNDLDTFYRWMNDGRVSHFWELAHSKEELREYLLKLETDPHTYPVIGCFNGEDAGYFETYWTREDRLGAYYDSAYWDRGWHGLIGERSHLGRTKTAACFRAITHYLFLDCPMTENIMGEPRADHKKMLSYADDVAYEKIKEFDFPHKRSALVQCRRQRFFSEVKL